MAAAATTFPLIAGQSATRGAKAASAAIPDALLAWYDSSRRELPWRMAPGVAADPYKIWLSEVMLQQTTVKTVVPYWRKFVARWPTVADLAAADREAVLQEWAGLGYYSRARNLHACAQAVVAMHGSRLPSTTEELRLLPGIGAYTSAAIAAIAFGQPATPVDGNIERVMARLFAVDTPLPRAKSQLKALAETLTPDKRAGDYAQALMDLGATVCTPRKPSCLLCPIARHCQARALGIEAALPKRAAKAPKPTRTGTAFVALTEDGRVLLRSRPETGLLAGMLEVPSTDWLVAGAGVPPPLRHTVGQAPVTGNWWAVPGGIVHVFTHFRLELNVLRALVPARADLTLWARTADCRWVHRSALAGQALPTVMRKVIAHALQAAA